MSRVEVPHGTPCSFAQAAGPSLAALKEEDGGDVKAGSAAAFSLEGAAAPAVSAVGTSDPVSDFHAMVKQDKVDGALRSMPDAILTLVQNSMGNR